MIGTIILFMLCYAVRDWRMLWIAPLHGFVGGFLKYAQMQEWWERIGREVYLLDVIVGTMLMSCILAAIFSLLVWGGSKLSGGEKDIIAGEGE